MKKILILCCSLTATAGWTQTFSEKIIKEISFDKKGSNNTLMVFNISGDVKIEGYAGDKILIEVEKKINGKTPERLEQGKQEIQLGVIDRADTVILYMQSPDQEFGKVKRKNNRKGEWNGWGYIWNQHHGRWESRYDYEMNFTIKVPASINIMASTVNNGNVEIAEVKGSVYADNVNGSIKLNGLAGATRASTINGSVDLDYSGNPSGNSRYYSLNGDINANFRKGLAAQLTFKSFNGDFYSSIDEITPMAVEVEKYDKGEGIRYKVNGNRYKVRQGGPLLDFETFNGNVYLREKTN